MSTENTDSEDRTTCTDVQSLVGGGEVTYRVEHRRERSAQSVVSKIETAIEMANAHAFNQTPRRELGTKRADTEYKLARIREAIEAVNDSPTFGDNVDGDVAYVVEDGYYPDEYQHLIDVTEIAKPDRSRAFLTCQSELTQRGYTINSIRTDDDGSLTRFHIVSLTWVYDSRSYGRRDER